MAWSVCRAWSFFLNAYLCRLIACGCGATTLVSRSQTPERTGDTRVDVLEEAVQNEEDGKNAGSDEEGEGGFLIGVSHSNLVPLSRCALV